MKKGIAVMACVALAASLLAGCTSNPAAQSSSSSSSGASSSSASATASTKTDSSSADSEARPMKAIEVTGSELPASEVTVTVYNSVVRNSSGNPEVVKSTVARLERAGFGEVIQKDTSSMDMNIVVYRSADYATLAEQIGEGLGITRVLEIPNDGSDGWSYSTDIAVVVI